MQKGRVVWITGLAGSGKTTLAQALVREMQKKNAKTVHIDGDVIRPIIETVTGKKWGHTKGERLELSKMYAKSANAIAEKGYDVVFSTIALFHEIHDLNRQLNGESYFEVLLQADQKLLDERRHLYKAFENKAVSNVYGKDLPPEFPLKPHLVLLNESEEHLKENVEKIIALINKL